MSRGELLLPPELDLEPEAEPRTTNARRVIRAITKTRRDNSRRKEPKDILESTLETRVADSRLYINVEFLNVLE